MNLFQNGFRRGVNLGGWMSQCDYSEERLNGFIQEDDFKIIADWGLDHVRLPVDCDVIQRPDGSMTEAGLARIDRALQWCENNGLNMVLDLHKAQGYSFAADERQSFFTEERFQESFYTVWETFARRYGVYTGRIIFDLLNEVTDRSYLEAWQRIAAECTRRIRQAAPEVPVLLGSYNYNGVREVLELNTPGDDRTAYNFHCYLPFHFTHQCAPWIDDPELHRQVTFAQSGTSPEFFEELFAGTLAKAEGENIPLYCGEYGVIDTVSTAEAIRWFAAIHPVFEKHGIGRAVWNYRQMDFGLSDPRWDSMRKELLKVL